MGLALPALRFLVRCHREHPFVTPAITLGRQGVHATYEEVVTMLHEEHFGELPNVPKEFRRTNIPQWRGTFREGFISDVGFFRLLGIEVFALDVSEKEHPDFVFDLNERLPESLYGRFGLVLDGGTLEHVFDIRQALANVAVLARPGGRVIHMSPASNYLGHGYYQFAPRLFADFYGANRFTEFRALLALHDPDRANKQAWDWYECANKIDGRLIETKRQIATIFVARKTERSTTDRIPTQGCYQWGADGTDVTSTSSLSRLKRLVPLAVKRFVRASLETRRVTSVFRLRYIGRF